MAQELQVREEDIRSLVRTQIWDKRAMFANLLPKDVDAETFAGLATAAMWKNPQLAIASINNPESLLIALRDCARLGHEPGTDEYALTVRGGGVLGIEQYQGVIARMFNAGSVQAVHAEVVTAQEKLINRSPLPPEHIVPDWLDRDLSVENLRGAYAYAILEGGVCSRVVIMGRKQIMTHQKAAATTKFWLGDFGLSMWLKTVVHELEKWVPTSAAYRKERARADAELAKMLGQTVQPAQTARAGPADAGPPLSMEVGTAPVSEAVDGKEEG